jgi:predicted ArsR family transcriptional regulator
MTTSRQKILTHLKKTRSASVREIARALKLSAPNVRHHLSVLCSDGLVETVDVTRRGGRGRPEKVYALSQAALGDNLSALTHALLTAAASKVEMEAVASLIFDEGRFAGQSMNKRLALLIEKLNEMHYQARWEAGSGGPRVIFGRCPYAKVIEGHPEICGMDAFIVRKALAREVALSKKNEPVNLGICPYIFQTL